MQINIQPGNNVSYNFQLPNKKFRWLDGVVLKRMYVQGESFKQRTFEVYFEKLEEEGEEDEDDEDEGSRMLLFDDDQYLTQWNMSPMYGISSSLQPGNNVSYKFEMHNRKFKWINGVILKRINVQGESFKQRTFKVYFEEVFVEQEVYNLLFDDDQYITQWNTVIPMSSGQKHQAIRNIQAAAAKEIQEIELRYDEQQQHTQSAKKQKI